jgi:NADH-quinone oxidoreductase subunit C
MDYSSYLSLLRDKLGNAIEKNEVEENILTLVVKPQSVVQCIQYLKEDEQMQFSFLTDLCGIHFPDAVNEELGVVYHLHNLRKNIRIRVKTFVSKQNPQLASITSLFEAANWMERETYDFYGIVFEGHPNLIRILNVEYLDFFPLRKEIPLEDPTREDKDNRYFGR